MYASYINHARGALRAHRSRESLIAAGDVYGLEANLTLGERRMAASYRVAYAGASLVCGMAFTTSPFRWRFGTLTVNLHPHDKKLQRAIGKDRMHAMQGRMIELHCAATRTDLAALPYDLARLSVFLTAIHADQWSDWTVGLTHAGMARIAGTYGMAVWPAKTVDGGDVALINSVRNAARLAAGKPMVYQTLSVVALPTAEFIANGLQIGAGLDIAQR